MTEIHRSWQPSAAYLYVLHLDAPSTAWEFLRRNPRYREHWKGSDEDSDWGLSFAEDPSLDARQARPIWCIGQRPVVRLIPHTDPVAQCFDLWAIPGRKSLTHEGQHLLLQGTSGRELVRLTLSPDMRNGEPFAYAMPAGAEHRQYRFTLETALGLLQGTRANTVTALNRPPRSATIHMRALQALDGTLAGATQRDIAVVLFGDERVGEQWSPDSELRAQVRYLVQRGRELMEGGYRDLLN